MLLSRSRARASAPARLKPDGWRIAHRARERRRAVLRIGFILRQVPTIGSLWNRREPHAAIPLRVSLLPPRCSTTPDARRHSQLCRPAPHPRHVGSGRASGHRCDRARIVEYVGVALPCSRQYTATVLNFCTSCVLATVWLRRPAHHRRTRQIVSEMVPRTGIEPVTPAFSVLNRVHVCWQMC